MHAAALVASLGTLLLVVGVALAARTLRHLSDADELRVASFAGGVSLAFVLLELFVELIEDAATELRVRVGPAPEQTIALLMLAGAALFFAASVYGSRKTSHGYAIALAPQIVYRVLVGAALEEELHEGGRAFAVFWLAMVVHFGVAEHGLEHGFPREHRGAWRVIALA